MHQKIRGASGNQNIQLVVETSTHTIQRRASFSPESTAFNSAAGDILYNLATPGASTSSVAAGTFSYYGLMHEIGIAVGLTALETDYLTAIYANLFVQQNSTQYSVMSTIDEVFTSGVSFESPDGLMLYDIAALQQIYGANNTTRNGATVYGYNSTLPGSIYDFSKNSQPAFSIWDGGGVDTLDSSITNRNQVFSLVAGSFSSLFGLVDNISLAYGVTIENATGGNGSDRFILSSDNVNNIIIGGVGTDTAVVTYNFGAGYTFSPGGTAANFTMTGAAGTDNFQGVEVIQFANGVAMSTKALFGTYETVSYG